MSGILDNKTRVLDSIITLAGRKQIASGKLKIEYASFSDSAVFYSSDSKGVADDVTSRIYLEACSLPQDDITFEADDDGRLNPIGNKSTIQLSHGKVIEHSFTPAVDDISEHIDQYTVLDGDAFASQIDGLLSTSIDNFSKQYIIGTVDELFGDDGFAIGNKNISFSITNEVPISTNDHTVNVNHIPSLFNDPRLSKLPNFNYLPPINKAGNQIIDKTDFKSLSDYLLGDYSAWSQSHINELSIDELMIGLQSYESNGLSRTIAFDPTSRMNNLICQFFEASTDTLRKLDVIEFGKFKTNDSTHPLAHIFFVGKILTDDFGTNTFIHTFTLIFD